MNYYQDQLRTISRYKVNAGETLRVDCPFCNGRKTLSITKLDGSLKWNCFKASCNGQGIERVGRNSLEIRNALKGIRTEVRKKTQDIPEILSNPYSHEQCVAYLSHNNCRIALDEGACRIEYAPRENRMLFFTPDHKGAVGRTLTKGQKPKWKFYGEPTGLFVVGNSNHVVLVEDAASACAVYSTHIYAGAALLGTHLSYKQRTELKQYENITICLDKDASRKAIQLLKQLRGVSNCSVRFLTRDLKEYTPERVTKVISNV